MTTTDKAKIPSPPPLPPPPKAWFLSKIRQQIHTLAWEIEYWRQKHEEKIYQPDLWSGCKWTDSRTVDKKKNSRYMKRSSLVHLSLSQPRVSRPCFTYRLASSSTICESVHMQPLRRSGWLLQLNKSHNVKDRLVRRWTLLTLSENYLIINSNSVYLS